jgi:hypothetical protein
VSAIDHLSLLAIVDATQIALDNQGGNSWRGLTARTLKFGPFAYPFDASLITDQVSKDKSSAFMKIRKDLWLYFVSENSGKTITCHVLNGNLCGLSLSTLEFVARGDADQTLKIVEKGVVGSYEFISDEWKRK